ncbi:MAG: putative phage abortive infection protein [Succinivibrio dextrinosolvens]|nr:putative phage abortive infection protein [Succinivibrio dextrinosolvens]
MIVMVLVLFLINLCLIFLPFDKDERGTFGDQFGAVNALFSGLAFAGLIYTIILQRHDLKLQRRDLRYQRRELELTRKEMEEQTAEFEKQNETLKIQRFENTFFNMLSQFQEVVNSLSVLVTSSGGDYESTGLDVFQVLYEKSTVYVEGINGDNRKGRFRGMKGALEKYNLDGYLNSDAPTCFDHYFRLLYRILKFVKNTSLVTKFEDEYEYTAMLRAVLSRYELVWLFYNGLTYGEEKLKPLIERYAMLSNLRTELLANCSEVDKGAYAPSAYTKMIPEEA